MKVRMLLLATIGLLGGAALGHAASGSAGIQAGINRPPSNLSRAVGDGFHAGFSVGIVDARNEVGIDATYHVFAEKTSVTQILGPTTVTERARLLEFALCFRAFIAPKHFRTVPYIKAGFGAHNVTADVLMTSPYFTLPIHSSEWWPGILGGVGVSTPLGNGGGLCLEGLFHRTQSSEPADFFTLALAYRSNAGR